MKTIADTKAPFAATQPLHYLDATALAELIRTKRITSKEVVQAHLDRIESVNPKINAIVTLMADLLPALIGGSIVIETLFSIPGMGALSYEAVLARDYPLIMAIFTLSAFLTLFGILVADFLYTLIDPRIGYAKRAAA